MVNITHKDGYIVLKLQSPTSAKATMLQKQEAFVDGTGTKYIKGRLTESYCTNWEFTVERDGKYWLTTMRFPYNKEIAAARNSGKK